MINGLVQQPAQICKGRLFMAAKTHQIAFEIAGKLKGDFANTFKKASDAIKGFNGNLNNLNKQAATTGRIVKLRNEVEASNKTYLEAKQRLRGMEQALKDAETPNKGLTDAVNKQRAATEKAKTAFEKQRAALKSAEDAAGTASISYKDLIDRQKQLEKSADRARIAQEKLAKASEFQNKLKGWGKSSAMSLVGIAGAVAPVAKTIKDAMAFEDMQAELGKYSDDSKAIFAGLTDLTKKYAKSAEDMTDMAAAAMQAGIAKTKEDVLTLVESQTQAAVAFGMTGDAVGSAWSDIQAKMGMNIKETQAVFDIVNKLGNETQASSEDVLNVLQRQGGTLAGLTSLNTKQIAAMAGAFRSASTSSEVAATSMGTFVSRLTMGESATRLQKKAFEALGLDAGDVAKKMTGTAESAEAVIKDVFARINKLSDDKRGAVIGQLFGNEAGIKSAVSTLAKNTNMLGDNLKMVGDDANYAGSMFKEYMARANTTSNAMQIFKNQLRIISNNIGQTMLPAVKEATQSFIKIAEKAADWISNNQDLVKTILKVGGAIVGGLAAFHALRLVFVALVSPIVSLYKGYQLISGAIAMYRAGASLATATTLGQKVALLAVRGAMLLYKAAIGLVKGVWVGFKAVCGAAWWLAQKAAILVAKGAMLAWKGAVLLAKGIWIAFKAVCGAAWWLAQKAAIIAAKVAMLAWKGVVLLCQAAQWAWNAAMSANPIGLVIAGIAAAIAIGVVLYKNWDKIVSKCKEMWATFSSKFPAIANAVKVPFTQIKIVATTVWNVFKNLIGFIKNVFTGQWSAAWQNVKNIFGSIWSGLVGLVKTPINAIIGLVNSAIGALNKVSIKIPKWVPKWGGKSFGINIPKIPQLAQGGIATGPTLAMIGEGREDEAVLPLSKLKSLMGGTGGGITVNFAPVINISGGGDAYADVKRGLDEGQRNLKRELQRLMRDQQRLSFA